MKRQHLIFAFLIFGCSTIEHDNFIEAKDVGKTTVGNVVYKIYQTGVDNYRYEFYLVSGVDTTQLFESHLSDATYTHIRLLIQENGDTIKLKSNWSLGQQLKTVDKKVFILTKKIDPIEGFGFTLHQDAGQVPKLMLYDDSIRSLTELEISIHRKIWRLGEVSQAAKDLKHKDIKAFTVIEEYPNDSIQFFTIRFGQILDEHLPTIAFYRVDSKSGDIEKMTDTGDWVKLK
jgi:hypothetical protein